MGCKVIKKSEKYKKKREKRLISASFLYAFLAYVNFFLYFCTSNKELPGRQ